MQISLVEIVPEKLSRLSIPQGGIIRVAAFAAHENTTATIGVVRWRESQGKAGSDYMNDTALDALEHQKNWNDPQTGTHAASASISCTYGGSIPGTVMDSR